MPRVIFGGVSSSSGKTTAVCAVLSLLKRKGMDVNSFKCGPDYIDPMFHESVLRVHSSNLDPFFMDRDLMRSTFIRNAGKEISVIEGVMGYYDGTGETGSDNSTFTVAENIDSPVILIINSKGAAASLLAVIEGFAGYVSNSRIKGVIFNRMSPAAYRTVAELMKKRFNGRIVPAGFIPELPEGIVFPSRHLGLVTAAEIDGLSHKLDDLADICEKTIDIDTVLTIAGSSPDIDAEEKRYESFPAIKIACAMDDAFSFYYKDTFDMFREMGAEIVFFSPLNDEPVPDSADGLYIGGGYPELYAERLSKNRRTAKSIMSSVSKGMPVIAECGGFQYLGEKLAGEEMIGVLPHESYYAGRLVRFGYITLTSKSDGLLGRKGTVIRGHEFHYYDSTENGDAFSAVKPNGRNWECAVHKDTLYAGYPHLYLPSAPDAACSFYRKCLEYKEGKQ